MAVKLKINGREHEAPDGQLLIEACRDAGVEIPRYCYHPGLPIAGSCRMCLVQLEGNDKLLPSCQERVRDGINVLTDTPLVKANQRAVMEFLLINHPLDCPVCDQAGECFLQDYSFRHGSPLSRFAEAKVKQPKKDVGRHILLYMDRCVMCTRCVRFTREVSGGGELAVVGRGSRAEIGIFPGRPLDNKLSGNVVDICPVGALLDKHFLHSQRVWLLKAAPSVCAGCSAGCNITVQHNQGRIWRLKPRENRDVNGFWMCDEGRYGWDYVQADDRLDHRPRVRRDGALQELDDDEAIEAIRYRLADAVSRHGPGSLAAVLSPMWTTEEQFLLARLAREIDERAVLAVGPAPVIGADEVFKGGFTIRAEKCPNRHGAERVAAALGGPTMTFDALTAAVGAQIKAIYLAGGYPPAQKPAAGWLADAQLHALNKARPTLIVHDLFATGVEEFADAVVAGGSWAEKSGTFVNVQGRVQSISAAPVGGRFNRPEGEWLWRLLDRPGRFDPAEVGRMMADAGIEGYALRAAEEAKA